MRITLAALFVLGCSPVSVPSDAAAVTPVDAGRLFDGDSGPPFSECDCDIYCGGASLTCDCEPGCFALCFGADGYPRPDESAACGGVGACPSGGRVECARRNF